MAGVTVSYHFSKKKKTVIRYDNFLRFLVKRQQEEKALIILNKIYQNKEQANKQLTEIKLTVSSGKEPLLQTLKYVAQWKNSQRYC